MHCCCCYVVTSVHAHIPLQRRECMMCVMTITCTYIGFNCSLFFFIHIQFKAFYPLFSIELINACTYMWDLNYVADQSAPHKCLSLNDMLLLLLLLVLRWFGWTNKVIVKLYIFHWCILWNGWIFKQSKKGFPAAFYSKLLIYLDNWMQ